LRSFDGNGSSTTTAAAAAPTAIPNPPRLLPHPPPTQFHESNRNRIPWNPSPLQPGSTFTIRVPSTIAIFSTIIRTININDNDIDIIIIPDSA